MKYKIKLFGIARDIIGGREVTFESNSTTVQGLKTELIAQYPELTKLNSLMIAVNQEYAENNLVLSEADELAIIPPVSGG